MPARRRTRRCHPGSAQSIDSPHVGRGRGGGSDWFAVGRAPIYLPVSVAPGQWGVADTPDVLFGKEMVAPRETVDWNNRPGRAFTLLSIPMHRPVRRAGSIRIPILLIVAETDRQAPIAPALRVARQAEHAELHRSKGGHYGV
jgi:uncharacterized protein